MHFTTSPLAWAIAFAAVANALPNNLFERKDPICCYIEDVLGPRAIPLCQSFLGTSTKQVTVTRTTIQTNTKTSTRPPPTQRRTQSQTTTLTVTSIITAYSADLTITDTRTVTRPQTTTYVYVPQEKRADNKNGDTPPVVDPALAPSVLSSLVHDYGKQSISAACKCVHAAATRTVTATARVTRQVTSQVTRGPVSTKFVTTTIKVSVTQEKDITTTLAPTDTETAAAIVTVTPDPAFARAICNARGLPGANAFNYDANFNTSPSDCVNSCKNDARCYSVGFYIVTDFVTGAETTTCRKYDKPVVDTADLGPGYYTFSDKDCPP